MKNLHPTNKLSTKFLSEKFLVDERQGSKVRVHSKDSGKSYERNVAHLKKVSAPSQMGESSETPEHLEPTVAERRCSKRIRKLTALYKA